MTALKIHSDFFKKGVFGITGADGEVVFETFGPEGHAARAAYLRDAHHTWSAAVAKGVKVVEYVAVAHVVEDADESEEKTEPAADVLPGIPTTAEDWLLYRVPGADAAGLKLAAELSRLIREEAPHALSQKDEPRKEAMARIRRTMEAHLDSMTDLGATDGETMEILTSILVKVFRPNLS